MDTRNYIKKTKKEVDAELVRCLPRDSSVLSRAMRYSVFAGGKRIRAVLALASARAVSGSSSIAMPAACAIEMMHTFSLIHDDLPAMDDDDLRRGKPTCHVKFGEGQAILAADALFALAYEVLSSVKAQGPKECSAKLDVINKLSKAVGWNGMCAGQSLDLECEGSKVTPAKLERIHSNKTGRLLEASVYCGARLAGADKKTLARLKSFSRHLGLAFQIKDDILDISGTKEQLGKTPGKDAKSKKATFPSVFGIQKSLGLLKAEKEAALRSLRGLGSKADHLMGLLDLVVERSN